MPFWRRRRALHEDLAEGTGLLDWRSSHEAGGLFKGTLDVLHGGRQREWDAVATAEAPDLDLDSVEFTALPDGTLLVDEELPDGALAPLAEAVESSLAAPYRARAVRTDGSLWSIAANQIDVLDVPEEIDGDVVSLAVQGHDRTLLVDDRPVWADVPTLAAFAAERHADFVLQAERLDGSLWAVKVNPL
jgi:hypothetical protein